MIYELKLDVNAVAHIIVLYLPIKVVNMTKWGQGGHILWGGEAKRSSPYFVNLSCAYVGLVLVSQIGFCFVRLPFFP